MINTKEYIEILYRGIGLERVTFFEIPKITNSYLYYGQFVPQGRRLSGSENQLIIIKLGLIVKVEDHQMEILSQTLQRISNYIKVIHQIVVKQLINCGCDVIERSLGF